MSDIAERVWQAYHLADVHDEHPLRQAVEEIRRLRSTVAAAGRALADAQRQIAAIAAAPSVDVLWQAGDALPAPPAEKASAESEAVARVEETCVGPRLFVHGVEVRSWLGTANDPVAHRIAADVNAAAQARPLPAPPRGTNTNWTVHATDHGWRMVVEGWPELVVPGIDGHTAKRIAWAMAGWPGEPPPPVSWSWHDLPERAAAAIAAIDVMQKAAVHAAASPLPDAAREAMREADAVVAKLRALHCATMGYEDACVLRGAEMVADALRAQLGGA